MHPIEAYKYLGLLSVVLIICGLSFLLWKWPQGKHMTFSQHAAQHRSAIIYYFLFFSLVLPLLLLFFIGWFAPTFHLSSLFSIFIGVSTLFQYSVVIIPEVGGWKTTYHVFGSAVSGFFLLFALIVLLFAHSVDGISKVITLAGALVMIGILYIGAKNKIKHPNLLVLQASYYAAFFAAVLSAAY
jgi:hypothetical protein